MDGWRRRIQKQGFVTMFLVPLVWQEAQNSPQAIGPTSRFQHQEAPVLSDELEPLSANVTVPANPEAVGRTWGSKGFSFDPTPPHA